MKPNRLIRLGELLKRELAHTIASNANEYGEYIITVTEVRVSRDLGYADAWISILGEPEERKAGLDRLKTTAWRLRQELAAKVYLRKMPELRFFLDTTLDRVQRIDEILKTSGIEASNKDNVEHS